jgi:hypothetical protein
MCNQHKCGADPADPQCKEACAASDDDQAQKDTRYKPGQSGNYKGRPKSRTYGSELHKVYTEPIVVNQGGKRRRVPAIVALQLVLLQRALNGDNRASEIVLKNAKEFGFLEQTAMHVSRRRYELSDETISRLTTQTLNEFITVERAVQAEKENSKKKPH